MSRSKHAVELCALLVNETYGELPSRIFTILLRRGRLPLRELGMHTGLTPHQLKNGLAVLIQQNLVYHHAPINWVKAVVGHGEEWVQKQVDRTYYEANHDAAYALVRTGKVMELVEERHGVLARNVVQDLFLLGHAKVSELAAKYEHLQKTVVNRKGKEKANGNHPNGNHTNGNEGLIASEGQLDSVLLHLLNASLIEPVVVDMFKSPSDLYDTIESKILKRDFGGSTKGAKQKDTLKATIQYQLQSQLEERRWKPRAPKRAPNGHVNGVSKRMKLSNIAVTGDHVYEDGSIQLDRDMVVRINYEKCTVALRSRRLAELASARIGENTSHIYAEVLRLLEEKIPRCRENTGPPTDLSNNDVADGPTITTMELMEAMSKTINPAIGIGKAASGKIDLTVVEESHKGQKRKANDEVEVEGEASSDEDEEDERGVNGNGNIIEVDEDENDPFKDPFAEPVKKDKDKKRAVTFQEQLPKKPLTGIERENKTLQLKNHLMLLAGSGYHLLRHCGLRGQGEWTVDFERAVKSLRDIELDTIIFEDFGETGHRLARIMKKFGKLDEKHLPTLALMKQKDVRTKLVEMQMAGMVDIQEVPRDTSRALNRTTFLWFFDSDRVTAIVLDGIYKAMSRILQRLEVEKSKAANVIELSERTDVQGVPEESYFNPEQLAEFRDFQAKEIKLLTQLGRLDELVGVFRDY